MATITYGTTVIRPRVVISHATTRISPNITHRILGRAAPSITTRPALLRSGTLEILFDDEWDAYDAESVLATPGIFLLEDGSDVTYGMEFAVEGEIRRTLDEVTGQAWIVAVGFVEVRPLPDPRYPLEALYPSTERYPV